MAKNRLQNYESKQVLWLALWTILTLGWGVVPGWSGQQRSRPTLPTPQTAKAAGQKQVKPTPVNTAKPPAERKKTTETASTSLLGMGKRDPFKLPETPSGKGGPSGATESAPAGGALPPGTRGLVIAQLKLEGVVREQTQNKMIAVVTNDTKRAYFLTENESVYNGVVSKITPDAVYFKENVLDADGRVTVHEVVKRLSPAPGEGR